MKLSLVIALLLFCSYLSGQPTRQIDSLQGLVNSATHDSTKIIALCRLSRLELDNTKSYQYVNDAITLAQKGRWARGEAVCYRTLGAFFSRIDYAKSLEYFFKSLRISEELKDNENIASALFGIGNTYRNQENLMMALPYLLKAEPFYRNTNSPDLVNTYNVLGIVYGRLGKTDSALYYFNRGYEISGQRNPTYTSRILRGLGDTHAEKGNIELAFSFYKKSINEAAAANNVSKLSETCQTNVRLSQLFAKTGMQDSALFYGKLAMKFAQELKSREEIGRAAKQLAELYEPRDANEALSFYKLSADMKDSIFGAAGQAQVQNLTFSEMERQRESNEARRKQAAERKQNLQNAAIALGLVSIVILFLLLSHSIMATPKFIRFFGVVALLIVFEYFNLLLHPYLGELTHHSPVLMLLIMVCVAALLVPLHHRLEHWITNRMIEKNSRIRLAAAKKTIEQSEANKSNIPENSTNAQHGL